MTQSPARDLARSRKYLTVDDVDLIQSLFEAHWRAQRPRWVADLGAGSGTTALAILERFPDDTRVMSVDRSQDALNWTEQAVKNCGWAHRWESWCSHTSNGPRNGCLFDGLLLDTSHEQADTAMELKLWLPSLRARSPVWLHDHTDAYPGVALALAPFIASGTLAEWSRRGMGWGGTYLGGSL